MSVRVFKQPGFLTADECLLIRRGMDAGAAEQAEILLGGIHRESDVRLATLIEPPLHLIGAIEAKFEACRETVAEALAIPLAEREGAGFIRYPDGGFYRPHRDRGGDPEWEAAARRAVALVLFLNTSRDCERSGEFDGGILRLLLADEDVDVIPEAGLLVAFPADLLHEVTEVRGGTRDAVVDWFYDRS